MSKLQIRDADQQLRDVRVVHAKEMVVQRHKLTLTSGAGPSLDLCLILLAQCHARIKLRDRHRRDWQRRAARKLVYMVRIRICNHPFASGYTTRGNKNNLAPRLNKVRELFHQCCQPSQGYPSAFRSRDNPRPDLDQDSTGSGQLSSGAWVQYSPDVGSRGDLVNLLVVQYSRSLAPDRVPIPEDLVLVRQQPLQTNGTTRMHLARGDAHLSAKPISEPVSKTSGGIYVDTGTVHSTGKAIGSMGVGSYDRIGVARSKSSHVVDCLLQIIHNFDAESQVPPLGFVIGFYGLRCPRSHTTVSQDL
mmetsp:Transcript_35927/g.78485  ORF Transcript_35927/g.78485 Transcript_35927/m.78485 type:complete len:304 (+) Transcript_35927:594-1505(+)